ncbi:MAG: hypothetical protein H6737_10000 [Alphaproteobacteria bacterium]|nr:hypothetical protein [Alphaproteobacteria bacterium]
MHLLPLLIACSGAPDESPAPDPAPAPAPARADVEDDYQPIRAPLEPPRPAAADIDLATADPMEIVAKKGPGGQPLEALSLVVASRGDGEIEPCG